MVRITAAMPPGGGGSGPEITTWGFTRSACEDSVIDLRQRGNVPRSSVTALDERAIRDADARAPFAVDRERRHFARERVAIAGLEERVAGRVGEHLADPV